MTMDGCPLKGIAICLWMLLLQTGQVLWYIICISITKKVQVDKDQEKAQSEKDSHSKKPRWEKPN